MFMISKKKAAFIMLIAVFFVILDRFLKFLAVNRYFDEPVNLIGDIFKLNFIQNYNIAFSLPISGIGLNIVISLILVGLLIGLIKLYKKGYLIIAYLVLVIILGAASNLYDRINYGFVIDYLDLKYFTVFNLADVMIVGGVIGLGWLMIRNSNRELLR